MTKDIADGVITKQEASKELPIRLKQTVEELGIGDTDKLFKDNDIIVGNYRFERENSNYDWTIVELSQVKFIPFLEKLNMRNSISKEDYSKGCYRIR
jgi:hypothetical protein